jgi:glycosyltransferase involved in cell wall biosynthesis
MEMDGPLNFIRGVAIMRRILKQGRFDVLNTHSRRDTIVCATAGRLAGTPLIVRTRHLAKPVNSLLSYTWLPHCVTTDSHFVRNQLITKGVAPERIENIYTPVVKPARIERSSLRQELGLTAQDIVVGCVAALRPTKGHLELVRAMAPLFLANSHLHLVIVGSGEEVAEYLIHLLDETDIDGFNLTRTVAPESHHDFIRLVIPELQQRGRYKTAYKAGSLRNKIFSRGDQLPKQHPVQAFRCSPYNNSKNLTKIEEITA